MSKMKFYSSKTKRSIVLVSFEYAGAATGGGIGTYVRNAAQMLASRGHNVVVFCGGTNEIVPLVENVSVISVPCERNEFPERVRQAFARQHQSTPFDVIEGPEYGADAAGIRRDFPDVPLVVRLHTPRYVIDEINHSYITAASKLRFLAGGLKRGRIPKPYWRAASLTADVERAHTLDADLVVAPSQAILDKVGGDWGIPATRSMVVPNVFVPPAALLALQPNPTSRTVLFIGRLEVRKGVLELAAAVPLVARVFPDVRFLMVGRSLPMPGSDRMVSDIMIDTYGAARRNVQHIDAVPYVDIPELFAQASIAVFPSTWENFPNVCLEGMAAARAVIGSMAGGMSEMITDGQTGLLVPPRDPKAIANAIIRLLRDPAGISRMGLAARHRVVSAYGHDVVAPLHEASFRRAIDARHKPVV